MTIELEERKRVLIISRHYPSYSQIKLIQTECGEDCLITWENQRFEDGRQIINWIKQGNYNEVALVAPKDVLATLVFNGLQPIHLSTIEIMETERTSGDFKKGDVWLRCTAKKIRKAEVIITYY